MATVRKSQRTTQNKMHAPPVRCPHWDARVVLCVWHHNAVAVAIAVKLGCTVPGTAYLWLLTQSTPAPESRIFIITHFMYVCVPTFVCVVFIIRDA